MHILLKNIDKTIKEFAITCFPIKKNIQKVTQDIFSAMYVNNMQIIKKKTC